MLRFILFSATLLALPLLLGCGSSMHTVAVSGQVTVQGEPLENGSITFLSADGETPSAGGVIRDGQYTADVPPGDKTILIIGTKVVGEEFVLEGVPDSGKRDKLETVTHANYNAHHLTPLKASITEGKSDLNFALTKDGKGA